MKIRTIEIAAIEVGVRLRALDPDWVALLAEEICQDGQAVPIRVVGRGNGYVLIDGARRVAATAMLGGATIAAVVEPEEALADAAFVRLGEIRGNLVRSKLTVLDRAYAIAAWREVYESVNPPQKRGRKPEAEKIIRLRNNASEGGEGMGDAFAERFSEAARKSLKLSRDSIYRALKIARIDPSLGHRLVGHPSAEDQRELLLLAEQDPERRVAVVGMITSKEPSATTVREAVDILDGRGSQVALTSVERATQRFARLSPEDQARFFDLNAAETEAWLERRAAKASEARRPDLRVIR